MVKNVKIGAKLMHLAMFTVYYDDGWRAWFEGKTYAPFC